MARILIPAKVLMPGTGEFNELDLLKIYPIAQRSFGRDFIALTKDGVFVRDIPTHQKARIAKFRAHFAPTPQEVRAAKAANRLDLLPIQQ